MLWRQRYLVSQRQYIPYLHYPSNLSLHCILSCYQGDNCSPYYQIFSIIRSPYKYPRTWAPRPCLLLLLISFASYSFVYSVYLGYEPEGSRLNILSFIHFVYLAIRTLGTLPRTWAPLRGTHWTEHHTWCRVLSLFVIGHTKYRTWCRVQSYSSSDTSSFTLGFVS